MDDIMTLTGRGGGRGDDSIIAKRQRMGRNGAKLVQVHPQDTMKGVSEVIFTADLNTFVPSLQDPYTGMVQMWGSDDGVDHGMASQLRPMTTWSMYRDLKPPEKQFAEAMMERKTALLEANRASREHLFVCDMELRVELVRFPQDEDVKGAWIELEPAVWRTFKVSGGITLRSLQDRVLNPAMGWCRNYHAYAFMDPTDGSYFGPEESQAIDMMHMSMHCLDLLPDSKVRLGELVGEKPGEDRLLYIYDFGDCFSHIVTLERVLGKEESDGKAVVLDGEMACPPEDSNGFEGMGCESYQNEVLEKIPLRRQQAREMATARNTNSQCPDGLFNPERFVLAEASERVAAAVRGKASVAGGEAMLHHPMPGFGGVYEDFMPSASPGTSRQTTPHGVGGMLNTQIFEMQTVRDERKKDPRAERICAYCGSPNNLKQCSGCHSVFYCGSDCQRGAWKTHKPECTKMKQERSSEKRGGKNKAKK